MKNKQVIPPVLHIGCGGHIKHDELELLRRQFEEACSNNKPMLIVTPPDVNIRFIRTISPKRNRFLNYRKSNK